MIKRENSVKKHLICGNYGAANIGDNAIMIGLISELRIKDPKCHITIMAADESAAEKQLVEFSIKHTTCIPFIPTGFRSLITTNYVKLIRGLTNIDTSIIGGGGLFTDKETTKAPWIWFIHACVLKLLSNRVEMKGQSVGPLKSFIAKKLTKCAYKISDEISVRDLKSVEVLRETGITHEISVQKDFAYSLPFKPSKSVEKNYTVVSLKSLNRSKKEYEIQIAETIRELTDNDGMTVYLKPMGISSETDEQYMNRFIEQYDLNKEYVHVHSDYSLKSTLTLFEHASCVIAMRLHGMILSHVTDTKCIALNYHEKVAASAKMYDKEQEVLEIDEISKEKLLVFIRENSVL